MTCAPTQRWRLSGITLTIGYFSARAVRFKRPQRARVTLFVPCARGLVAACIGCPPREPRGCYGEIHFGDTTQRRRQVTHTGRVDKIVRVEASNQVNEEGGPHSLNATAPISSLGSSTQIIQDCDLIRIPSFSVSMATSCMLDYACSPAMSQAPLRPSTIRCRSVASSLFEARARVGPKSLKRARERRSSQSCERDLGGVVGHDGAAKQTSMESSSVSFTWSRGLVSGNL
jgi:hypothetical protein